MFRKENDMKYGIRLVKNIVAASVVATSAVFSHCFAETVTIDGIQWTYQVVNNSKNTVRLGHKSDKKVRAVSSSVKIDASQIPWTFTSGGRQYTVVVVGQRAFYQNKNISGTLNIPDSVIAIGVGAFTSCTSITNITGCNKVTSCGQYAFAEMTGCKCEYPKIVSSLNISKGMFFRSGFGREPVLNKKLQTIPYEAFSNNSITNVAIPDSVTTIGQKSFSGCRELKSVVVPGPASSSSVTTVSQTDLFSGCTNLSCVVFGKNTKCLDSTKAKNSMFKGVTGCTVFVPRSGWDGVLLGGNSTKVVYFGQNEDIDISVDAESKVVSATVKTQSAFSNILDVAESLWNGSGYTTRITTTRDLNAVSPTSQTLSKMTFQHVEFPLGVTFKIEGQGDVDNISSQLQGSGIAWDVNAIGIKSQFITSRDMFINVPAGTKYNPTQQRFTIVLR